MTLSRKTHPLEYEHPECANPECRAEFKKLKGSPVRLCEGCLVHPNLVARYAVRDERERTHRQDY